MPAHPPYLGHSYLPGGATISHMSDATSAVRSHVENYFAGHPVELRRFDQDRFTAACPISKLPALGRVLECPCGLS
jgi:hypothetical protein